MLSNAIERLGRCLWLGALTGLLAACGGSPSGSSVAAAVAKANTAHGKELYAQCGACHQLRENSVGPRHCGLFGRRAGTVAGFEYSEAMKTSDIVWDVDSLDEFLKSPIAFVDGTRMGFAGFDNPTDRADVIAYLQQKNSDPDTCPHT